jgi:hypothetical protein
MFWGSCLLPIKKIFLIFNPLFTMNKHQPALKLLLLPSLLLYLSGGAEAQQKPWSKCPLSQIPQANLEVAKGISRTKYPFEKTEEISPEGQGDQFDLGPEGIIHQVADPVDGTRTARIYTIEKGKACECQFSGKNLAAVRFPVTFTYPEDPEIRKRTMEIYFRPGTSPVITKIVVAGTEQYQDLQSDRKIPVQTVITYQK